MVLLLLYHYCYSPATQPPVRRSSFQSPSRCSRPTTSAI